MMTVQQTALSRKSFRDPVKKNSARSATDDSPHSPTLGLLCNVNVQASAFLFQSLSLYKLIENTISRFSDTVYCLSFEVILHGFGLMGKLRSSSRPPKLGNGTQLLGLFQWTGEL
jgi:hypothetical protein